MYHRDVEDAVEAQLREAIAKFENDEYTEAVLRLREVVGSRVGPREVESVVGGLVGKSSQEVALKCRAIAECDAELVSLLSDMLDSSRWHPYYESRGIKVSLEESSDRLIRVKCEGSCDVDAFAICASLLEVDLFPEWMPGVDEAAIFKKVSRFRKLVRVSGKKPWPMKRDEAAVVAYGDVVDCARFVGGESRGAVAVYMKPASSDVVPRTKGRHQISITGGWLIEPICDKSSRVTLVAKVDPRLRFLPSWVINFVVKNLAYLFIPMIAKHATSFARPHGRHTDRIDVQPDIYCEIERRLATLRSTKTHETTDAGGQQPEAPPPVDDVPWPTDDASARRPLEAAAIFEKKKPVASAAPPRVVATVWLRGYFLPLFALVLALFVSRIS